ncbi:MAG: nicotinate phosphoribosyltransferase [SAR324 cluster bacterium]|jgi:nicotinate phosphoribosyltransferase|nr:nicotinate phosphoribosyltransferase [SAR324 cluster bacterium]MCH2265242.1 nicotinate phosphoribosyltransferase [SAR324 cluster bacterium]
MTIFNRERLTNDVFKIDVKRMRRGWYSDKYFENIGVMLSTLAEQGYVFKGENLRLGDVDLTKTEVGNLEVEMQWFTRRTGKVVVAGVDKALTMLRHCSGYFNGNGKFVNTWNRLKVEAVHDGTTVTYNGDPMSIQPVIRVRGCYRDFALLETPTLGLLTRSSRVATNVYETLMAARGKPVLFFPARFDLHEVQAADGYAYNVAVQRFNQDHQLRVGPYISTDAQGDWWGGAGGGTVAHASIACFFGDTAETMMAFASACEPEIPRIALVDFNNDSVKDSLLVMQRMFARYRELIDSADETEAQRYHLFGVRLDTSSSIRDVSVTPLGEPELDMGVNPRLVFIVRNAVDTAWKEWNLPQEWNERARKWCVSVKIVVSGGFNPAKISRFEKLDVPVDIYAVGSSLFANDGPRVTDYTADVAQVKIDGAWRAMSKVGRNRGENPDLETVA